MTKPGLATLIEPPSPTAKTERWGTLACSGTWNEYRGAGEYGEITHVQRLYDLMPEPKFQLIGLGKRHGWLGKVIGGAFGVGAKERVRQTVEWLDSHSFDRLLIIGHSRGAAIAGAIIKEMERRRDRAWREGRDPSPWCHVDCLVLLDPVLSMGFHAPAKWMLRFMPRQVQWHFNVDRFRTLSSFVHVQIALYALDECRRAFEATHFRLTHPEQHTFRRWLPGVHSTIGGYGPKAEQDTDVGSWLRSALSLRIPMLREAAWPWPAINQEEWKEAPAVPEVRRILPGDLEVRRRVAV